MKLKVPESDATSCPKLDTTIEGAVKRDSLDQDGELSCLQNFLLDTRGPLVASCLQRTQERQTGSRPCQCRDPTCLTVPR